MCSPDGKTLCIVGVYMRQFPEWDLLHETMDRLAKDFPICASCQAYFPPRHIVCTESLKAQAREYAKAGLVETMRRYLALKSEFMQNTRAKQNFLASLN